MIEDDAAGASIASAYSAARTNECRHSLRAPDVHRCSRCAEDRGEIARVARTVYVAPPLTIYAASSKGIARLAGKHAPDEDTE